MLREVGKGVCIPPNLAGARELLTSIFFSFGKADEIAK
jgi:hypothetical protein